MKFVPNNINKILKYQLIILVGIFVILEGFLGYNFYKITNQKNKYKTNKKITVENNINEESMLTKRIDGTLTDVVNKNLYPVAVMIDNHFDAWPNYGLNQANIVYETLVEGNFTRFLAIYTPSNDIEKNISKIGPVRSARPYFLEIVKEYDALFAHSGGSPQALQEIEKMEINNLEEIAWWGPDYFWRVYSRLAPHNLFTSSKKLAQAVIDWELNEITPNYRAWQFSEKIDNHVDKKNNDIKINFSQSDNYDAVYKYSSSTDSYLRWQGEDKHLDALTNEQIKVNNIVIQFIPKKIILDNEGRLELNLIGTGEALIFRDGQQIQGSWKKRNTESRTIFYDNNENEIAFKPGNIWIEIVPENLKVEVE